MTSVAAFMWFAVVQACNARPKQDTGVASQASSVKAPRPDADSDPLPDAGMPPDAAARVDQDTSPSRYRRTTIAGREAVVVPEELAADYFEPILFVRDGDPPLPRSTVARGRPVAGYFTPGEPCLQRLEAGLEGFLTKAKKRPELASKQRQYKAQYAGFRTDGPRVHATFLCREIHAWEWDSYRYTARWTAGGGDCFFDVVFGCEDGVYSDFAISD